MSRKEVPRPGLTKLALAGQITNQQGAAGSKLTVRQFQRVMAKDSLRAGQGMRAPPSDATVTARSDSVSIRRIPRDPLT
jgi:CRP-like cAMP-binding protein